jgi:hypothetical protein
MPLESKAQKPALSPIASALSLPSAPPLPLRPQPTGEPSRPPPPVHEFVRGDVSEERERRRAGSRRHQPFRGGRVSDASSSRPSSLRPPFRGRRRRWSLRRICRRIRYRPPTPPPSFPEHSTPLYNAKFIITDVAV